MYPTRISKSPPEHFMRTLDDEFSKFERKERQLHQAERRERAAKLRLPVELSRPLEVTNRHRSA
jgi:hypothetical protein